MLRVIISAWSATTSLDSISAAFPLSATSLREKGSRGGPVRTLATENVWHHEFDIGERIDAAEITKEILDVLSSKREEIKELSKSCLLLMSYVVGSRGGYPAFHLPPDMLSAIASFGFGVDVDMYS